MSRPSEKVVGIEDSQLRVGSFKTISEQAHNFLLTSVTTPPSNGCVDREMVNTGSWFGDWRVTWLGGWTRDQLSYIVMVAKIEHQSAAPHGKRAH